MFNTLPIVFDIFKNSYESRMIREGNILIDYNIFIIVEIIKKFKKGFSLDYTQSL
jgi:hypothetical protein